MELYDDSMVDNTIKTSGLVIIKPKKIMVVLLLDRQVTHHPSHGDDKNQDTIPVYVTFTTNFRSATSQGWSTQTYIFDHH